MAFLKTLFWNDPEARLRAGWRLSLHLAVTIGLIALLTLPLGFRFESPLTRKYPILEIAIAALRLTAVAISLWLAARFIDRRPVADFGLHFSTSWWVDFGFGLALGGLLTSGMFLIGLIAGLWAVTATFQSRIEGIAFPIAILLAFVKYVCVGIYEELVSRGYHLKNLSEGLNTPRLGPKGAILLAILLSSMFFAFLHIGNYGASMLTILDLLLGGIVLSLGFLFTGEIAIPIGFHIAYNFFSVNVFGTTNQMPNTAFIVIEYGDQVTSSLYHLLSIGVSIAAMLFIFSWLQWRNGRVRLHEELATANLLSHQSGQVSSDG